jgi:hypothetical protein
LLSKALQVEVSDTTMLIVASSACNKKTLRDLFRYPSEGYNERSIKLDELKASASLLKRLVLANAVQNEKIWPKVQLEISF